MWGQKEAYEKIPVFWEVWKVTWFVMHLITSYIQYIALYLQDSRMKIVAVMCVLPTQLVHELANAVVIETCIVACIDRKTAPCSGWWYIHFISSIDSLIAKHFI